MTANSVALTPVSITAVPSGVTVRVDGQTFVPPRNFDWVPGSSHSIAATVAQPGGAGVQYFFNSLLLDGANVPTTLAAGPPQQALATVIAPATSSSALVFNFKTMYSIATTIVPATAGTVTLSPAPAGGFYDAGSSVQVTAVPASGYAFLNWNGDLSGTAVSQTLAVNIPSSITANFIPLTSVVVTASPAGPSITVDGTSYTSPHGFSWVPGSVHSISTTALQTIVPQGVFLMPGSQYTFANWSDGGALSHTVVAPATSVLYTASFSAQYQLYVNASPYGSGSASPASGSYYTSGQVVTLTATPGSAYNFGGWSGAVASPASATTTITMNGPATVTANFTPAVRLTTQQIIIRYVYPGYGDIYQTYIYACNSGALAAQSVHLSTFTLNTQNATTSALPTVTVQPGACEFLGSPIFLVSSIGASGTSVPLRYTVTYSGSSPIITSLRVTLPHP